MKTIACLKELPVDLAQRLFSAKVTRVSLRQMYAMGRQLLNKPDTNAFLPPARFLHRELPIRLAQSAALLDAVFPTLPPAMDQVTQLYIEDIRTLINLPQPDSTATENHFNETLKYLGERQCLNMIHVGHVTRLLSNHKHIKESRQSQHFLNRFYSASFGTCLLISEHLALRNNQHNLVDIIKPYQVAQQAASDARNACATHFKQEAPEVQLVSLDPSTKTTYIYENLHRILFETLSFSLRSTMERHLYNSTTRPLSPIQLVMVNGHEDITFKVSDEAGGTPARQIDRLWHYTLEDTVHNLPVSSVHNSASNTATTMAISTSSPTTPCPTVGSMGLPAFGFGRGLPVARLAARYFGGDLDLVSMEGRGTDVYIHLARTDTQLENFPVGADVPEIIDPSHWEIPSRVQEV